jgi:hypothetical protein
MLVVIVRRLVVRHWPLRLSNFQFVFCFSFNNANKIRVSFGEIGKYKKVNNKNQTCGGGLTRPISGDAVKIERKKREIEKWQKRNERETTANKYYMASRLAASWPSGELRATTRGEQPLRHIFRQRYMHQYTDRTRTSGERRLLLHRRRRRRRRRWRRRRQQHASGGDDGVIRVICGRVESGARCRARWRTTRRYWRRHAVCRAVRAYHIVRSFCVFDRFRSFWKLSNNRQRNTGKTNGNRDPCVCTCVRDVAAAARRSVPQRKRMAVAGGGGGRCCTKTIGIHDKTTECDASTAFHDKPAMVGSVSSCRSTLRASSSAVEAIDDRSNRGQVAGERDS